MELTILSFGIAKDIVGGPQCQLNVPAEITAKELKAQLLQQYPAFQDLRSLAIAINNTYATDDQVISPTDEVVLIPPVSGG
ncbi:MAG: MoaD/ThiS family protein [Bacteroidota bacterium]